MKQFLKSIAIISCCVFATSCAVISHPIAATDAPFGNKCGVSKSVIYCGIVSRNGSKNGIHRAAKKGNIKRISHVDSYVERFLGGLIITQITKVYGE